MRVIAGTARGVPLTAPKDHATRPITDRVKETLFGILGERVVDAHVHYAARGARMSDHAALAATFEVATPKRRR